MGPGGRKDGPNVYQFTLTSDLAATKGESTNGAFSSDLIAGLLIGLIFLMGVLVIITIRGQGQRQGPTYEKIGPVFEDSASRRRGSGSSVIRQPKDSWVGLPSLPTDLPQAPNPDSSHIVLNVQETIALGDVVDEGELPPRPATTTTDQG